MSKTVYKYDKKIRRWYREVDGKRQENLKLGVGYNTTNGQYLFNSDGTKTKLNPNNSRNKPNPTNNQNRNNLYFTSFNPFLPFNSGKPTTFLHLDLYAQMPKFPFKPSKEVLDEFDRRSKIVKDWEQQKPKLLPPRLDSKDVTTWDLRNAYAKQLQKDNDDWLELRRADHSRKIDDYSIKRGYKIKLIELEDMWGNPTKKYYFVNPKTGETGNAVSKYYAKEHGLDMKGVTPVTYVKTEDRNIYNLARRDNTALVKRATKNIEGPKSSELANAVTGGAFNLLSPTNVYGGIRGGFRKDQSFLGAVQNTLFGFDAVNPEKSGNLGLLETTNGTANWAARHPMATAAINAAGDMVLLGGINKALKMPGTNTGIRTARYTREGLGSVGRVSNMAKDVALDATKQIGSKAITKVKQLPGGSMASSTGKKVLNTGLDAWNGVKNYGIRTIQRIPLGTRQWTSNAWNKTGNFFGYFKPINLMDRGLRRITGYGLTSDARAGYKAVKNMIGLGLTGYGLLRGEDVNPNKFSKLIPYIPGIAYLEKPYDLYSKIDTGIDTYNNIEDMNDWGYNPEGIFDTSQGFIDLFGKG